VPDLGVSTVELDHIVKRYNGLIAVDDVTLSIGPGELVTLLGPSGCGKTSTLNLIAGFLLPDSGSIRINGSSVERLPPHRRNTAMVFQGYALFPHLTVARNVAFGLEMRRVPRPEIERRVGEALELVRLAAFGGRYPAQLSGGQQQRVAIARALALRPDVLLMDEPLSNLDAKLREEMRGEIRALQQQLGITTVYVTHDQEEALALSDRVVVMQSGRIEQVGAPREIYRMPCTAFVADFIGGANLVPVRVVSTAGDVAAVIADDRFRFRGRAATPASVGADMLLMVRPEHVHLAAGPAGANSHPATVIGTAFLGGLSFVQLRLGRHVLRARITEGNADAYPVGSEVSVCCPADNCAVLPAPR